MSSARSSFCPFFSFQSNLFSFLTFWLKNRNLKSNTLTSGERGGEGRHRQKVQQLVNLRNANSWHCFWPVSSTSSSSHYSPLLIQYRDRTMTMAGRPAPNAVSLAGIGHGSGNGDGPPGCIGLLHKEKHIYLSFFLSLLSLVTFTDTCIYS